VSSKQINIIQIQLIIFQVYKSVLYEDANGKVEGFPQVFSWSHEYGHNIMVMELLGAPVASLFAFCDRKFAKQV
jgi:hypothetical protein